MRGAGDHSVGHAEVDKKGAEIGHVGDGVGRLVEGDALVRPQPGILIGEGADVSRVGRRQDPRAAEIDTELLRTGPDRLLIAEDDEIGDPASEHSPCGTEHPVVFALGQHDRAPLGPRTVEQLVLEHERRHDVRVGDAQSLDQGRDVDMPLEQSAGPVDSVGCVRGEAPGSVHDSDGGLIGPEIRGDDGQPRPQSVHEP
ncbi:hypothetical protein ABE10_00570, partial [Bacillus toyonensis]|nr:hypothetical protein [Bacillus toyonensis]